MRADEFVRRVVEQHLQHSNAHARARARGADLTAPTSAAAAPAPVRTAPGATKAAILTALTDGTAMTAGEIAAAIGLARATVSTTLSKLAASVAIAKAARGYQLRRESDTTRNRRGHARVSAQSPRALYRRPPRPGIEPAVEIAAVEAQLSADSPTETVEDVRLALIAALEARQVIQR